MPKQTKKEPTGANAVFVQRAKVAGKEAIVFQSRMGNGYEKLSNFTVVKPPFTVGRKLDRTYATSEHYFQSRLAQKLGLFGLARRIRAMPYGTREELIMVKHAASQKAMLSEIFKNFDNATECNAAIRAALPIDKKTNVPTQAGVMRYIKRELALLDMMAIMRKGLEAKFAADKVSRDLLLGTGDAMIGENSFRSGPWGISKEGEPGIMGTLLMEIRADLRASEEEEQEQEEQEEETNDYAGR